MALGTPSWLNRDFTEGILRRSECDNSIQVIDIFSKSATDKGDNYASDMIRITVEYSRKSGDKRVIEKKSIIAKISPMTEGARKDLIDKSAIFYTEIAMMTNTLEKMNDLLGPESRINGRALHVQKESPTFLVIEDLGELGFRMANRQAGLDLEHSTLAIRGLAKFHASSVALCEKEPNQKTMYIKGMFSSQYPTEMSDFFIASNDALAEEVATWPEVEKKYADKIKALSRVLYSKGKEATRRRENEFAVINHGDCWVNNMLFRYNDQGKPIGHIFVDFQLCVYTSPAIDLHYFLCTSTSEEIFYAHKETLLQEYLRTLTNTMKRIGCKTLPPTMDELQRQLKEREIYAVIASFTVLPIVIMDKSQATDLDEMLGKKGEFKNPGLKGETYRKIIGKRIPIFGQKGLLDA